MLINYTSGTSLPERLGRLLFPMCGLDDDARCLYFILVHIGDPLSPSGGGRYIRHAVFRIAGSSAQAQWLDLWQRL